MPNIVEYNAPQGMAPQPTDLAASTAREAGSVLNRLGRESGAAVGGAIERVGGQVGAAVDAHMASQAIGHGAATYSQMFSDLTKQWNALAANADPNDTSVADKFRSEVLEPALQKFNDAFSDQPQRAQDWAMRQMDLARQHFFTTTSADMSTRAAYAVHQNLQDIERNFSNTAYNDPTTLEHASQTVNDSIGALIASSPNLSADQAAKIKTEVVPQVMKSVAKATALGIGSRNPDQLIADVNAGKFDDYLNAAEKNAALDAARRYKEQQYVDVQHQNAIADRAKKEAAEGAKDEYVQQILTGKGFSVQKMAMDTRLRPEDRENLSAFQHEHIRQLRENVDNVPHPQEFRLLLNGMFDTARTDPNNLNVQQIRDAFKAGKLNPREEAELEMRFNAMDKPLEQTWNRQLRTFEASFKTSMQGQSLAMTDPTGYAAKINQMDQDFHDKLAEYRREGKDVNQLLDPKNGFLSPNNIKTYFGTPAQNMSDGAAKVRAKADADAAIGAGADKVKVAARYKQLTGEDYK